MRSTIKDDMLEALMQISINGPKVKERNGVVKESVQQRLNDRFLRVNTILFLKNLKNSSKIV